MAAHVKEKRRFVNHRRRAAATIAMKSAGVSLMINRWPVVESSVCRSLLLVQFAQMFHIRVLCNKGQLCSQSVLSTYSTLRIRLSGTNIKL